MKQILLFTTAFFSFVIHSQNNYTGYSSDNSNGYTGSYFQPASIVNSVNKWSFAGSFASFGTNNYLGRNASILSIANGNQQDKYKKHSSFGYNADNYNIDILSFHYEINHKNALGYSFRTRYFENISGLPKELTKADFNDFDSTTALNTPFTFKNLNVSQFLFNEHRFNYARVLIDDEDRMLKVGGAFKILNGIDATFFHANSGTIEFNQQFSPYVVFKDTEIQYGRAEKKNQFSSRKVGLGFDIGAVYEFRPDKKDYYYDMDGEKHIERYDESKYLYKIGVSITDIGRVKFSKDQASYNFTPSSTTFDIRRIYDINIQQNGGLFKKFDDVATLGTKSADQKETFNMNLPTSLNLQFDYHFKKNIFFNYAGVFPLRLNSDPSKVYFRTIQTFTARIERKNWSFMLPISFQRNATVQLGISGRYGLKKYPIQLFAGTYNINNFLGARAKYSTSAFVGILIVNRYKVPSDVDGDLISDEKDACMYDPGLAKFKGCPDIDADGIPDKEDYCIYTPGTREKNGCPDADKDGIIDLDDQCPEEPGLAIHYGCPDRDKDGVIDVADRCPDVPGIELNNGCPFENQGCCSDNDGDGISNTVDKCPEISGSVYNNGCPIDSSNLEKIKLKEEKKDKDPNNTIDKTEVIKDKVKIEPTQEGTVLTKPFDRTGEIESINIYFNVDDATVLPEYDLLIRKLAAYNFKDGKYKLVMIGHTDNDGADNYNLILSKKRAETVRRKFESNKVDYDLITVYYYGENKPVKSNDNDENKKFNRRVEVIVMKVN